MIPFSSANSSDSDVPTILLSSALLPAYHVEGELKFVLQLQGPPGDGSDLDAIVGLQQSEFAVSTKRIHPKRNLSKEGMAIGDAVKRQLPDDIHPMQRLFQLVDAHVGALKNHLRIARRFEDLGVHHAMDFPPIAVPQFVQDFKRICPANNF